MRIIIPIKQVPETRSVKMDETTGTVIRQGVESIVNPLDLYAIETALRLKEQYGGETVAVTMGPPQAETALREALSMGVDQAVLVSDRAYAGSDTWATAYILAAAISKLGGFDLIVCGERATDGDTGQVGPELAAALNIPVASYVNRITNITGSWCVADRRLEDGEEQLQITLPAILTVVKEIGVPRLPTLDGKIRARRTAIPIYSQKELQLPENRIGLNGSPTRVVKIFRPAVARQCQLEFGGDDRQNEQAVAKLFAFLQGREVV